MTIAYTIITGGLGGLGSAFALECARLGRHLLLVDQHNSGKDLVAYLQSQFPIDVLYQQCDLADQDDRLDLILGWKSQKMIFNGLINIVGIEVEGKFLERTREEVIRMVNLNNIAMVDLTLAALNQRSLDQRFFLINIASLAGFFSMPHKTVYAGTKRFVINFSMGIREEIRDFGNVTVVCPAGVPTNAEAMRKIFLQGFWGRITAQDTGDIVRKTLSKVQRNVPIYIPGGSNKLLVFISRLLPEPWLTHFLAKRWEKRQQDFELWRIVEDQRQ